jgi:hypothetical protein
MTFRNCKQYATGVIKKIAAGRIIFRQNRGHELLCSEFMKTPSVSARLMGAAIVLAMSMVVATRAPAQNYYTTNGTEYAIIGSLPGDQVYPDVALSQNGGFVVWQDNITDGSGWGISAQQVDSTLSGSFSTFRVNVTGLNDQENPRVALLKNGGAAFVWQGGLEGFQHIYARFLNTNNTFLTTTDLLVSQFKNNFQINPAIATLSNSNVVIVWASYDQAGSNSMQDVYAKILSPSGATISNEFLVNQFTSYNQRTPSVAALSGGGFVVTWVSEQETVGGSTVDSSLYSSGGGAGVSQGENNLTPSSNTTAIAPSADIYARLYLGNGAAVGNEFLVNTNSNPCANPNVAAASDGGFMVAWSAFDLEVTTNAWDVYARPFSSGGTGGSLVRLNSYLAGAQYAPRLSAIGLDYLAVWTSLGEDGSREGVYGQFIRNDGTLVGGEFRINTTTISQQMQPAVASDGVDQFVAIWTSYTGSPFSFDLFAQRYINAADLLNPMPAPFVYAPFTVVNGNYQPQLVVSWAPLLGITVSNYEVFVNGSTSPMGVVTTNQWTMTSANGLTTSSTNWFQVSYSTVAGISPASPASPGTTWGGQSWGGIPFEWMTANYGTLSVSFVGGVPTYNWPSPNSLIAPGGPTIYEAFLSGATTNPATWLHQSLTQTAQGMFLSWNTTPGATYQVQSSSNSVNWSNFGGPRFAAGTSDSLYVGGRSSGFYRVVLLRQ